MQTKSNIQLIGEICQMANNYKDSIDNLMEKYTIEDSIFVYRDNELFEAVKGYFIPVKQYDNLADAVRECWGNFHCMGIRVENNEKFTAGRIKNLISECTSDERVFDIEKLVDLR